MANVNGNWKGGKAVVKYSKAKAKGRKLLVNLLETTKDMLALLLKY